MALTPLPDHRPLSTRFTPPATAAAPAYAPPLPLHDAALHTTVSDHSADAHAVDQGVRIVRAACDLATGRRQVDQLGERLTAPALRALRFWAAGHRRSGRLVVRSVHAQQPTADAVEICVRVEIADHRHEAVALRLELLRGRWLCVAFDTGPAVRPRAQRRS